MKVTSVLLAFSILSITGCSDEPKNTTYTILKRGEYLNHEHFDVIHVYGFGNNALVADEITAQLNKTEPGSYSVRENP